MAATGVGAHGLRHDVRVEMAPTAVAGLTVEIHQDLFAPQLAVSNRSGKLLEILDDAGRPFLRIGGQGAEGDVAAKAYHLGRVAGGGNTPPGTLSPVPRWRPVAKEPAFGWFDARIATATLEIPYAVQQMNAEMPFAEWRIPARLGGEPLALRGVFTYVPPTTGMALAVMQTPSVIAPGVMVQMVAGAVPVFFLSSSSRETVAVLDGSGKPFLKVEPSGVWADVGSPSWQAASPTRVPAGRGWVQISKARSITWREPRAAFTGKPALLRAAASSAPGWQVPLSIGGRPKVIRGSHRWVQPKPLPPRAAALAAKP
jgi:hypothetical protein